MVRRALIFGNSFIRRLETFTHENCDRGWLNLGLDGTDIQVEFFGLGGGTLRPGNKCVQKQQYMHIIEEYMPHSVFLQVGGNDLSSENEPVKIARDISVFADYIINCYHVNHVVIGQLLPRYSERPEAYYNNKVYIVNKELSHLVKERDNATFWHHRGLWKNTPDLLLKDKVHLNDEGMEIYARSVRAAVGSLSRTCNVEQTCVANYRL